MYDNEVQTITSVSLISLSFFILRENLLNIESSSVNMTDGRAFFACILVSSTHTTIVSIMIRQRGRQIGKMMRLK